MLGLKTAQYFIANPLGGMTAGQNWLAWQAHSRLGGVVFWNTLDRACVSEVLALWMAVVAPPSGTEVSAVFDIRHVRTIDSSAFAALDSGLPPLWPDVDLVVRPVCDSTIVSATILGGLHLLRDKRVAPASTNYTVLGLLRPSDVMCLESTVQRFIEPNMVERLSRWLAAAVTTPPIERACETLGVSTRTLQRVLAGAGTSYRELCLEAKRSRLADAVLGSNDKLDAVAASLGFTSGSSMSTTFKRMFGESPSEFRLKHRALATDVARVRSR